jgi:hypothetical protein
VSESNRVQKYTLLCLRMAAECRNLAEDVPTSELRARFLHMAGTWTELADQPGEDTNAYAIFLQECLSAASIRNVVVRAAICGLV